MKFQVPAPQRNRKVGLGRTGKGQTSGMCVCGGLQDVGKEVTGQVDEQC